MSETSVGISFNSSGRVGMNQEKTRVYTATSI